MAYTPAGHGPQSRRHEQDIRRPGVAVRRCRRSSTDGDAAAPSGDRRTIEASSTSAFGASITPRPLAVGRNAVATAPATEPDEVVPRRSRVEGSGLGRGEGHAVPVGGREQAGPDRGQVTPRGRDDADDRDDHGIGRRHQPEPARDVDVDPVDPAGTEHVDPVGPGRPPGVRRTTAAGADEQERPGRILRLDRAGVHPLEDAAGVDPPDPRVRGSCVGREGRAHRDDRAVLVGHPHGVDPADLGRGRPAFAEGRPLGPAGGARLGDDRPDAEEIVGRDLGRDLGPGRLERAGRRRASLRGTRGGRRGRARRRQEARRGRAPPRPGASPTA